MCLKKQLSYSQQLINLISFFATPCWIIIQKSVKHNSGILLSQKWQDPRVMHPIHYQKHHHLTPLAAGSLSGPEDTVVAVHFLEFQHTSTRLHSVTNKKSVTTSMRLVKICCSQSGCCGLGKYFLPLLGIKSWPSSPLPLLYQLNYPREKMVVIDNSLCVA
jgi:hypothetical protein